MSSHKATKAVDDSHLTDAMHSARPSSGEDHHGTILPCLTNDVASMGSVTKPTEPPLTGISIAQPGAT